MARAFPIQGLRRQPNMNTKEPEYTPCSFETTFFPCNTCPKMIEEPDFLMLAAD